MMINNTPIWQQLTGAFTGSRESGYKDCFIRQNTPRIISAGPLILDYSNNLLDGNTLSLLLQLAEQQQLPTAINALFAGKKVNQSEQRAALHTLLRAPGTDGDYPQRVKEAQSLMRDISDKLRAQAWLGTSGQAIRNVVNIGIGGSDLGPRLVCDALANDPDAPITCHYVSNVDPNDITQILKKLNPHTTLFLLVSKSFTTDETLTNATIAKTWLKTAGIKQTAAHFIGVTSQPERAIEFGLDKNALLPMWDWVGGRFSLWSAVGLSIAIAVGYDNFAALLSGAHTMDQHFANTALDANMPVILALLGIGYNNFLQCQTQAILPYSAQLRLLPSYLQQLHMESLGKRVTQAGAAIPYDTGYVLWGSAGTDSQHSFHQLLHQGTRLCPADFIMPLNTTSQYPVSHEKLLANCYAQIEALKTGQSNSQAPHRHYPGCRPSNLITMDSVNAESLGALIALYEHKVYVQSVIWDINAFDQWGVELGKQLAHSQKTKKNA